MLTAELVHVRRRGAELFVVGLDAERRQRAHDMAAAYADLARVHVGLDRQSFMDACKALRAAWSQRDVRLAEGLFKLVLDRCVFEEETGLDAAAVRAHVFAAAAHARRHATGPSVASSGSSASFTTFDRETVLQHSAAAFGQPAEVLECALYGDLPAAHILKHAHVPEPETLVRAYDLAQVQAVLLRATSLVVTVAADEPAQYRDLFRTLKFHQLLFTITPLPGGGYQILIDGPYSLFDAVTRYGLKLALALPAIMACGTWNLTAQVLWGRERQPLQFRLKGTPANLPVRSTTCGVSESVDALLARWPSLQSPWQVQPCQSILDLPGVGLSVPDLEFRHASLGTTVYFEQLGFWSRDAVWKRVELAQAGLPFPIVFGVSKHLRVSERILDDDLPAALYVFAKLPSAKALCERIESVATRWQAQRLCPT